MLLDSDYSRLGNVAFLQEPQINVGKKGHAASHMHTGIGLQQLIQASQLPPHETITTASVDCACMRRANAPGSEKSHVNYPLLENLNSPERPSP